MEAGGLAGVTSWEKRIPAACAGHGDPCGSMSGNGQLVLGISERTDCMLGSVSLEGTPCIGRARDRNGGRVGRSGTKEDMGPQRGVGVDVERGGEQTGEIEMAWGDVQRGFIDVNGKRMMAKSAH